MTLFFLSKSFCVLELTSFYIFDIINSGQNLMMFAINNYNNFIFNHCCYRLYYFCFFRFCHVFFVFVVEICDVYLSVTNIGDCCFECCRSIEKITLSSFIPKIGAKTFCDCSSLKEITIPSSVTVIESYSFDGCLSLEKLKFHQQ